MTIGLDSVGLIAEDPELEKSKSYCLLFALGLQMLMKSLATVTGLVWCNFFCRDIYSTYGALPVLFI